MCACVCVCESRGVDNRFQTGKFGVASGRSNSETLLRVIYRT